MESSLIMKQNVIFSLKDKETSPIMFCVLYDTQRTIDETKKQSMLESNERIQNKNAVRKKKLFNNQSQFYSKFIWQTEQCRNPF